MEPIFVSVLLALAAACGALPTGGAGPVVETEREFTLSEGAAAVVRGPDLAIRFVAVTEDTRCPIEANCVGAGHATVQLRVTRDGREPAILTLRTDAVPPRGVYDHNAIELVWLDPEPSIQRPNPAYRVRLVVYPVFTID